jgi:hypothetical protein
MPFQSFYSGKNPSSVNLYFLLNIANKWHSTILVRESERSKGIECKRTKLIFISKAFLKVCTVRIAIATALPKEMQALYLPLKPTHPQCLRRSRMHETAPTLARKP